MKCPKCEEEMEEQFSCEQDQKIPDTFICFNEKCEFYGIKRLNKKFFEAD